MNTLKTTILIFAASALTIFSRAATTTTTVLPAAMVQAIIAAVDNYDTTALESLSWSNPSLAAQIQLVATQAAVAQNNPRATATVNEAFPVAPVASPTIGPPAHVASPSS